MWSSPSNCPCSAPCGIPRCNRHLCLSPLSGSHPLWGLHYEDRDRVPDTSGSLETRRPLALVLGAASSNAQGRAGHWGLGLTPPLCSLPSGRPQQPKRLSSEGAATFPRSSVLQPQVQVPVGPAELGGLLEGIEGTGFPERDGSLRLFIFPHSSALGCVPIL